jgi:hypothetical protein
VTSNDLAHHRNRQHRRRAVLGAVALVVGEVASVIGTERLGLPVHWATVALIAICTLWFACIPLFVEAFDRSFNNARRREDLTRQANELAGKLHDGKHPDVVVWSSPEAGFEGLYHLWIGKEVHVVLRNEIDSMPEGARDFALARAVDSAISSRRTGWRLLIPDWNLLVATAAVLLSAALGEWAILGSCVIFLVPIFVYMLAGHQMSKRARSLSNESSHAWSYWPNSRQLAVDRRAVWAAGGISGAREWYSERVTKSEGHARDMLRARLAELERDED